MRDDDSRPERVSADEGDGRSEPDRIDLSRRWQELRRQAARRPFHIGLAALVWGLLTPSVPIALIVGGAAGLGLLLRTPRLVALIAFGVVIGAAAADVRLEHEARARAAWSPGERVAGEATILEVARKRASGARSVRVRWHDGRLRGVVLVARVESWARWPDGVPIGARIRVRGRLQPLPRFERFQARRGAAALLTVASASDTRRRRGGVSGVLDRTRERAEHGLASGQGRAQAALARGLILGQDDAIAEDVRDDFRASGLAHVLAVSGQNVLLLAILVMAAGMALGLGLRTRLLLAIVLIAIYVPLAGGGPSIQRAGVMGAAGLVAALAGRPASRWYALGLAAAITLVLNPRIAEEPGWQLSFAAVIGLLALARPLTDALARLRIPRPVAEAAAVTAAATIATAPLMAYHFESISLVSLAANLLAAPLIAPLMWLGMLAAAAGQLDPAAALPFAVAADPLLRGLAGIARLAARLPSAQTGVRIGSPLALGVIYAALIAAGWGVVWLRRTMRDDGLNGAAGRIRGRQALLAVMVVVCGGLLLWPSGGREPRIAPPGPDELLVSFLDVGQGSATVIQRGGATVLFDTGPDQRVLRERLEELGVRRIDLLVLSHPALDHDAATEDLLDAGRVRAVVDGGAGGAGTHRRAIERSLGAARIHPELPRAGEAIRLADAELRVLWPREEPGTPAAMRVDDANDAAVVLLLGWRGVRILLPADAEGNVTSRLTLPRLDALAVAHHGSADPDLPALLERTRPGLAVISVGHRNRYGHPTPATLAALRSVPQVLRTDRDGTVHLRLRARPATDGSVRGRATATVSTTD